jgi:hydrogenase expression/formation protein HypE
MGKLSSEELSKLLKCIGTDPRVIIPPKVGFDSGVHLIDDKYLVVSTDPCINVPRDWFGWLLVNYAASDVALFGAEPEFCTINLLGPPSTKPQTFHQIMKQTCQAAHDLEMAIVTGHTGTYHGLSTVVGACTAYGTIDKSKLITPGGAKPRDHVFCLKPLGQEVAINLALTRKVLAKKLFGSEKTQKLKELVPMQSCVREALLLAENCDVHAMHDATEGGLTAALNEIAEASKVGFRINFEKIPISDEVQELRRNFRLSERQLLSISSTGTILAAVSPEGREKIESTMRQNKVQANDIGIFTKDTRHSLTKNNKSTPFPTVADDPYARILSGKL